MPFLTELDPNIRVKSSVDPLGFEPLWSMLGRRIITNLTTITQSFEEFQTILCGLALADKYCNNDENTRLEIFLRFEQLCAYARTRYPDINSPQQAVRGTTRVKKNLATKNVTISPKQDAQILSNQKQYGLWGMFTLVSDQNIRFNIKVGYRSLICSATILRTFLSNQNTHFMSSINNHKMRTALNDVFYLT